MPDPEPEWLISAPVIDGEPPYPGSEVRWCSICAAGIWLSPAALGRLERNHRVKPVCLACAVPMVAAEDHVRMQPADPNAPHNAEILSAMRRAITQARKERKGRGKGI